MPFHPSRLRRYRGALLVAALFLGAPLVVTAADAGQRLLDRWRVRRMSDLTSMPSPAYRPLLALATSPDVSLEDFEGLLGERFDPGEFDEVDVAGNGRILAYTSLDTTARRDVVLSFEGRGGEADRFERLSVSDGDTEHPSIDLDRLGYRVAVRGTDATGLDSDIYLVSRRKFGDGEGATLNVTDLPRIGTDPDPDDDIDPVTVDGEAWDPCLVAFTRNVDIGEGIERTGRDARIAFVCTADLDKGGRSITADVDGANPDGFAQLFLWSEREDRFRQLTQASGGTIDRPSMNGRANLIAFESTADLTPQAVHPFDPSKVGNPSGVRQIYVWRRGEGVTQVTWSDLDCWSPRTDRVGRAVWFSSRADLVPGGNPERNSEIFRWNTRGPAIRRLAQITATEGGDNVLPRPTDGQGAMVFYSTCSPRRSGEGAREFGDGPGELIPKAYVWRRGRIDLVHGSLDEEGLAYFYGPPAPGSTPRKVHLGTNDPLPKPDPAPGTDDQPTIPTTFFMVRATKFARPR